MVVDDWQFEGVASGTLEGIKESGLTTLFQQIFITPKGAEHNEYWHNGYAIFLLKK